MIRGIKLLKPLRFTPARFAFVNQASFKSTSDRCADIHFKVSSRAHPLIPNKAVIEDRLGDHTGRQQNHIWSEAGKYCIFFNLLTNNANYLFVFSCSRN